VILAATCLYDCVQCIAHSCNSLPATLYPRASSLFCVAPVYYYALQLMVNIVSWMQISNNCLNAISYIVSLSLLQHIFAMIIHFTVVLSNVTGFAKRGLPHTSTFMSLKYQNFVLKYDIYLNFSPSVVLC